VCVRGASFTDRTTAHVSGIFDANDALRANPNDVSSSAVGLSRYAAFEGAETKTMKQASTEIVSVVDAAKRDLGLEMQLESCRPPLPQT
jgi:hypothetical protein